MKTRAAAIRLESRCLRFSIFAAGCALAGWASAQTDTVSVAPLPSRDVWRTTASSVAGDEYGASLATDGKLGTRWSSVADDNQWLQIDLGSCSTISGVTLHWEEAFARSYEIQTATQTSQWTTVYTTTHGNGNVEEIYFPPVVARHVRIACTQRATTWGFSLWEVDLHDAVDAPLAGNAEAPDLWYRNGEWEKSWLDDAGQSQSLILDLRRSQPLTGVRVGWGDIPPVQAHLAISADQKIWSEVGAVGGGDGTFDALPDACMNARYLRITLAAPLPHVRLTAREIALLRPTQEATPLMHYYRAAARAPGGLYPDTLQRRQTYWTVFGLPGDTQKSLLDEYGTIEPIARGNSVTPFLRVQGKLRTASDAAMIGQELEDGFLPIPSVIWRFPDLSLTVETLVQGTETDSVSLACYTIVNSSDHSLDGDFLLAIRPIQVCPAWQHGGLSPIRQMSCATNSGSLLVHINGRDQYAALTPPDACGVCEFDEGDIAEYLRLGVLPPAQSLTNSGSFLSGALSYRLSLPPGGEQKILLAMPLHNTLDGLNHFLHRDTLEPLDPADSFRVLHEQRRREWLARLGHATIEIPDRELTRFLYSQVAYMLLNGEGFALNPGPRNYRRVWIRDGAFICAALLRTGQNEAARAFIDWYAAAIDTDGLVPPILNNDGTRYQGIGGNHEYDSQGQFVFAVMEYYRFTRDRAFLQRHFETLQRVLRCTERLRNRTLRSDYCANDPLRARYAGLLPASISHEGYAIPVHSYWDDFFALKGWKDGRDAALALGRRDAAEWAGKQYDALRASVRASIDLTIRDTKIDYIPGCAERGDCDPNATSAAFFPCDEQDLLPVPALEATYQHYYQQVVERGKPGWAGIYTPYEARNLNALVQLDATPRAMILLRQFLAGRHPPAWNHLAEIVLSNPRQDLYIGDMPHTWVGADLVTAIRNLFLYECADHLELLDGVPEAWVAEGSGLRLENLPSHFGAVSLTAVEQNGQLRVDFRSKINAPKGLILNWPFTGKPGSVQVNGAPWLDWDANTCRLPCNFEGTVVAQLPGGR